MLVLPNPSLTDPIWGTIIIEVPEDVCPDGGVWYGTWAGKMSLSQGYVCWYGVMNGVSGCVEGLKVRFGSELCYPVPPCLYTGMLVDPHGSERGYLSNAWNKPSRTLNPKGAWRTCAWLILIIYT